MLRKRVALALMWGNQSRQQDNFDPYDYEESPLDDHEVKKEQQRTPRNRAT